MKSRFANAVRVGLIGCGKIADVGHLPALANSQRAYLVALADPNEVALAKARYKFKVPFIYKDPMDLIHSGHIDAVVIASPNWAHSEQTVAACQAGLHVLVEKPMAVTRADCLRMISESEKASVILQVGLQKRFHWGFQVLKELIADGAIGVPFQFSVTWNHFIPDLNTPFIKKAISFAKNIGFDIMAKYGGWRLIDPRSGGGDLMDHGPHYFDLFRFILGEPSILTAEVRRIFPSRIHEDHGIITINFNSGAIALLERSQNYFSNPYGRERGYVHGTSGRLYFRVPHEYTLRSVKLYKYGYSNILLGFGRRIRFPGGFQHNSYVRQMEVFLARIRGEHSPIEGFPIEWAPGPYDGIKALEMVFASYCSSHTGQKVKLPFVEDFRTDNTELFPVAQTQAQT